jgi:hypothetical protein
MAIMNKPIFQKMVTLFIFFFYFIGILSTTHAASPTLKPTTNTSTTTTVNPTATPKPTAKITFPPTLTLNPTTAVTYRTQQQLFEEANIPLPPNLLDDYNPPNYTLANSVYILLSASSWRQVSTVEFTRSYAVGLAVMPILLVLLFIVFLVVLIIMVCTAFWQRKSIAQLTPVARCTCKLPKCMTNSKAMKYCQQKNKQMMNGTRRNKSNHQSNNNNPQTNSPPPATNTNNTNNTNNNINNDNESPPIPPPNPTTTTTTTTTNQNNKQSVGTSTTTSNSEYVASLCKCTVSVKKGCRIRSRRLTKPEAQIMVITFFVCAWIFYIASFGWSWTMYNSESYFATSIVSLQEVFTNVNETSTVLNHGLLELSLALTKQATYCPVSSTPPPGITQDGWNQFISSANSVFTYMRNGINTIQDIVEQGPLKIAPAMLNVLADVETTSYDIITARTAIVGVLLAIVIILVLVILCLQIWYPNYESSARLTWCERCCLQCNRRLITCLAILLVFLFTVMVGLLFSLLFFTGNVCNPDPIVFLGRLGGLAEDVSSVSETPPAGITLDAWCSKVLGNLSDPLQSKYEVYAPPTVPPGPESTTATITAPISTTMLCYYGSCKSYHKKTTFDKLEQFLVDFWIPLNTFASVMQNIQPDSPCVKYINSAINATREIVIETMFTAGTISCKAINPIFVNLFYTGMCNNYVYLESVLTALVLSGNIFFTCGILIAVAYDLIVEREDDNGGKGKEEVQQQLPQQQQQEPGIHDPLQLDQPPVEQQQPQLNNNNSETLVDQPVINNNSQPATGQPDAQSLVQV